MLKNRLKSLGNQGEIGNSFEIINDDDLTKIKGGGGDLGLGTGDCPKLKTCTDNWVSCPRLESCSGNYSL